MQEKDKDRKQLLMEYNSPSITRNMNWLQNPKNYRVSQRVIKYFSQYS